MLALWPWLDKLRSMPFRDKLLALIGTLAMVWYFVSIGCLAAPPDPTNAAAQELRQFMALSVTTISTTLATFVGMFLGIREQKRQTEQRLMQLNIEMPTETSPNVAGQSYFQAAAAMMYVVSIVLALLLWWLNPALESTLQNLSKSLLGLIVGVLAVLLNTQPET